MMKRYVAKRMSRLAEWIPTTQDIESQPEKILLHWLKMRHAILGMALKIDELCERIEKIKPKKPVGIPPQENSVKQHQQPEYLLSPDFIKGMYKTIKEDDEKSGIFYDFIVEHRVIEYLVRDKIVTDITKQKLRRIMENAGFNRQRRRVEGIRTMVWCRGCSRK